jgi:hypothetical protein
MPDSTVLTMVLAVNQNDNFNRCGTDKAVTDRLNFLILPSADVPFRIVSKRGDIFASRKAAIKRNKIPGIIGSTSPITPITTQMATITVHSALKINGIRRASFSESLIVLISRLIWFEVGIMQHPCHLLRLCFYWFFQDLLNPLLRKISEFHQMCD